VERTELAAAMYHCSHLVGSFTLRSGRTVTEYFDKYRFTGDPTLLRAIGALAVGLRLTALFTADELRAASGGRA
jgi:orotate phosphoribosyltransferase